MIGDHRDVVAIDVRGTGPLGAIDCPDLQDGEASYDEWVTAVDACGTQLGDAADDYGPVDRALDVEAVRQALGYDQIVYHGQSSASADLQAYAARFPIGSPPWSSIRARPSTISTARSASGWPTGCSTWSPPSAPSTPAAGRRPRSAGAAVSALVETLGAPGADVDAASIISLIDDADASIDLVPAAVAYAAGDHKPLLELVAGNPPSNDDNADPADNSIGDNFAGTCDDVALPYDVTDPVDVRRRAVSDHLDQLPD